MTTFLRFLLRHRALFGAAIFLSLAASLYAARKLELRFQFSDFYSYPENPALPLFKHNNELFGDPAGYVVAMVEADDVFRSDVLGYVDRLTRALEPLPAFSRVVSLTNVSAVRGRGDEVVTGKLMPVVPERPEQLAELKRFVLDSPLLVRRLVSADGKSTAVLADMRIPAAFATIAQQEEAVAAFRSALAQHPPPASVTVRLTGAPTVEIGTTQALISDQLLLLPVVCAILGLLLYLTFRSFQGVLLCLSSVAVATVWTSGLFTLFGRPVDIYGSVIPTTLLVYGVVDPIFVLARFRTKVDSGRAKNDAIVEALSELALPCFLTSLTTSIGFAAFITCIAPSVRFYGLTVGIGVMLAFVTTMTVLPLLLSVAPLPKQRLMAGATTQAIDRALAWAGGLTRHHAQVLVVTACALLAAGGFYARAQRIDNAYVGSLPNGKVQDDVRRLEKTLSGVVRVSVHLSGPAGVMTRPEVLRAIDSVDRGVERESLVTYSGSLADLMAETQQAFQGGARQARGLPRSATLARQYLALLDPRDRASLVTDDFAQSHIAILLEDRGSEATRAFGGRLEQLVARAGFENVGVEASITGHGMVAYRELDGVVVELLVGFITAFAIVLFFEWLVFRSLRLALLTIIPNLIPVVVLLSVTRALGIALRIDSILVLCVSIGGLFNTTIHFVARVLQQVSEGKRDADEIIVSALRTIGPPSLYTSVILSLGFAAFGLSSFPGLKVLGLLAMVTLGTGFLSDVFFTPALIRSGLPWDRVFRRREQIASGEQALAAQ